MELLLFYQNMAEKSQGLAFYYGHANKKAPRWITEGLGLGT